MATYFDSSAILDVLLEGTSREAVSRVWNDSPARVTSILSAAEGITALRRAAVKLGRTPASPTMRPRFEALEAHLDSMVLLDVDGDVLQVLRLTPSLNECRSLDAVHLATALLVQRHLDEPVTVCTLDRRMRDVAEAHDFTVVP